MFKPGIMLKCRVFLWLRNCNTSGLNLKRMNRNLFLLITISIIAFTGCKKDELIVPNRTIVTEIRSGNWVAEDEGRTLSYAIDMPEIDDYFNQNGGVLVYISFDGQTYEPVPQVFDGVSFLYYSTAGQIVMQLQSADGVSTVDPPGATVTVKIVLIESV